MAVGAAASGRARPHVFRLPHYHAGQQREGCPASGATQPDKGRLVGMVAERTISAGARP
jgi:hypothetical protein